MSLAQRKLVVELTVRIHKEEGTYWADVSELSGCFASGDNLDELFESLKESIALYLADEPASGVRIERQTVRPPLASGPDRS